MPRVDHHRRARHTFGRLVAIVLLTTVQTLSATTHMSVEPIPNRDVIGADNLALLRSIGYSRLARWSERLLSECRIVDGVIDTLTAHGAITSVRTQTNTRFVVAAGGFEGETNPSYVFTVQDSGPGAVSAADVNVLDNALGYVLNQGGTVHFSPDNPKAYAFALDYAVVTFSGTLSGDEARQFFERLGTIDTALFSGQFAGFTQIDFARSPTNNSMLFLQPAVSKNRFINGLAAAAATEPRASYFPLKNNATPTTARAGIAFPGNDWLAFPAGDQYLGNVGGTPQLVDALRALRQQHLTAVNDLLAAIARNRVDAYLDRGFTCPN
ncbi:MAG TPA: hypothetical protein VN716_01160 [Vicinamibacterales bacterium]|nr:hypothetical protein [Vicinamibacterales bacterium]